VLEFVAALLRQPSIEAREGYSEECSSRACTALHILVASPRVGESFDLFLAVVPLGNELAGSPWRFVEVSVNTD
jgi:hypothetical protein